MTLYIFMKQGFFHKVKNLKALLKQLLIYLTQFRPMFKLRRNHSIDLNWFLFDRNIGLFDSKKLTDFLESSD